MNDFYLDFFLYIFHAFPIFFIYPDLNFIVSFFSGFVFFYGFHLQFSPFYC